LPRQLFFRPGAGLQLFCSLRHLPSIPARYRGHLVMLLLFSAAAFEASSSMSAAMLQYPAAVASARRILELAESPPPVPEPLLPLALPADGSLSLHNVSFAYGANQVLRGFSLEIPAGGRVALTGRSGSGKSSVVELLLRFREYDGSILFGGRELKEYAADDLRSVISALPQQPHLFNATLRENIVVAHPAATADEIAAVVHDAALDIWIESLPEGLETRVGEGGGEISGGEARRVALARTLLKDVPFYLLDEPTEGLDAATEQLLLARLDKRLKGKSLLLVTHRPGPLRIVDRIVRMG